MRGPVEERERRLGDAHVRGDLSLAELEFELAALHGIPARRPAPAHDLVELAARGMVEHEGFAWAELAADDRYLWLGRAEAALAAAQRTA